MDLYAMAFASGWTSGINAYATVLVLGLFGRFGGAEQIPTGFQRVDVLCIMAVLALLELLADKIPYVDSFWDTVSTFIRPVAGAVIAGLIAGQSGSLTTIALAGVGGVTALLSHLTKSSLRLAINTTPEPVSNVSASVVNDVSVVGIATLAATNPVPAAIAAGLILLIGVTLALLVLHQVRRGLAMLRSRFRRTPPSTGAVVGA